MCSIGFKLSILSLPILIGKINWHQLQKTSGARFYWRFSLALLDFLNCLLVLDNYTARAEAPLIFNPSAIRGMLLIAHFYQVEALKQKTISSVMIVLLNCERSKVTAPQSIAAVDSVFADC
jgi:hypothetical protein